MAEREEDDGQGFALNDFNIRLRDNEERMRVLKERVLLLGQNLIDSREDSVKEIRELKSKNAVLLDDIRELKSVVRSVVEQVGRFATKNEMAVIERMLKDFQPLEFVRVKDLKEMIDGDSFSGEKKSIKTKKTIK